MSKLWENFSQTTSLCLSNIPTKRNWVFLSICEKNGVKKILFK